MYYTFLFGSHRKFFFSSLKHTDDLVLLTTYLYCILVFKIKNGIKLINILKCLVFDSWMVSEKVNVHYFQNEDSLDLN